LLHVKVVLVILIGVLVVLPVWEGLQENKEEIRGITKRVVKKFFI